MLQPLLEDAVQHHPKFTTEGLASSSYGSCGKERGQGEKAQGKGNSTFLAKLVRVSQ